MTTKTTLCKAAIAHKLDGTYLFTACEHTNDHPGPHLSAGRFWTIRPDGQIRFQKAPHS